MQLQDFAREMIKSAAKRDRWAGAERGAKIGLGAGAALGTALGVLSGNKRAKMLAKASKAFRDIAHSSKARIMLEDIIPGSIAGTLSGGTVGAGLGALFGGHKKGKK